MFFSRKPNYSISKLQERALRILHNDNETELPDLIERLVNSVYITQTLKHF